MSDRNKPVKSLSGLTSLRFEELPMVFTYREKKDGWYRDVEREGTVSELLDVWNIDDPDDMSEMVQVLRYLKIFVELTCIGDKL